MNERHLKKFPKFVSLLSGAWVVASIFSLSGCKTEPQISNAITIGVQPNEKDRDLTSFRTELAKRTGMEVKIFVPKDYEELVSQFKQGKVDFAFFSPITFIQAERDAGAKALLKKVYAKSEFYYAAIVVRADSKLKDLKSLVGKKFGFVDPKSTSGFLYPRVMMKKEGSDPFKGSHEFLGTHQAAVQALLDKKVDAIGVWADEPALGTGAWSEGDFMKSKKDFRVLAISDPIPNDAFAVREKYYRENPLAVFKVMEALIGMSEDPNRLLKKVFNVDGIATATSMHYESVRALEGLLKEGQ